jgi:hypothetical protein
MPGVQRQILEPNPGPQLQHIRKSEKSPQETDKGGQRQKQEPGKGVSKSKLSKKFGRLACQSDWEAILSPPTSQRGGVHRCTHRHRHLTAGFSI